MPPRSPFSVSSVMSSNRLVFQSSHEIAAQGFFVVNVAGFGEDHGAQSVLRDAAGASELDGFDDVGGDLRSGGRFAGR